jgi:hypothetical protein
MKKSLFVLLTMSFVLLFATSLSAGTLDGRGKAWLDAQKDPPEVNVSGDWDSEFGNLHLRQTEGGREVSGIGGEYELTGVVSGKRLFLLFSIGGSVDYCTTVSYESDKSMTGTYSNRVSRHQSKKGLCQGPEKSRPMYMSKK